MSIERFFNESIVIRREEDVGGAKTSFSSTETYDAHVQQIQDIQGESGEFGSPEITHKAWTDVDANITVGDRVTDAEGVTYDVVGINQKEKGVAMNEHLQVFMSIKK